MVSRNLFYAHEFGLVLHDINCFKLLYIIWFSTIKRICLKDILLYTFYINLFLLEDYSLIKK